MSFQAFEEYHGTGDDVSFVDKNQSFLPSDDNADDGDPHDDWQPTYLHVHWGRADAICAIASASAVTTIELDTHVMRLPVAFRRRAAATIFKELMLQRCDDKVIVTQKEAYGPIVYRRRSPNDDVVHVPAHTASDRSPSADLHELERELSAIERMFGAVILAENVRKPATRTIDAMTHTPLCRGNLWHRCRPPVLRTGAPSGCLAWPPSEIRQGSSAC